MINHFALSNAKMYNIYFIELPYFDKRSERFHLVYTLLINFCILLLSMLPALAKPQSRDFKPSQLKIYEPPREMSHEKQRRQPFQSYRQSAKAKIGGGFKLSTNNEDARMDALRINEYVTQQSRTMNLVYQQRKGPADLNQEIKMIEKKIRQCQKRIDEEKRLKEDKYQKTQDHLQDFEEVIKRELKLQGYTEANDKHFDYLTNPGGHQEEPQQIEQAEEPEVTRQPYSISEGLQKLEHFYQNSLKKKFQRREAFPHQACRRKIPKLHITPKTNTVAKQGRPMTEEEHKFRVMTRQTTPQEIYPVIPNFAVIKDNLSKNIVAYLGEYKPFLDKTKEKIQNQSQSQPHMLESSGKSITIAN